MTTTLPQTESAVSVPVGTLPTMSVKGAFAITLSGPYEGRSKLLQAMTSAGIAAQVCSADRVGLDEEAKGWIEATFHQGTDSPDVDFQRACLERVTSLAEPAGYETRSYGIVMAGAAQMTHVVHKETGEVVMKAFNMTPEGLPKLARVLGVDADLLELREPPGLWDVPTQN